MNKYGNRKTEVDGFLFDSKKEATRYSELVLLEKAGEIFFLELQPKFTLLDGFRDRDGKAHRAIKYIADFQYQEDGKMIVEDTKGYKTQVFRIKEKLFRKRYPTIIFKVG